MSDTKQIDVEKLIDSMLEDIVPAVSKERARELEKPEEEVTFSPEHEAKMRKLFRRERRCAQRKRMVKYTRRAAALLAAALVLGACFKHEEVNAWLVRIKNYFLNVTQQETAFHFEHDGTGDSYQTDELALDYIPDGFELKQSVSKMDGLRLSFEKEDLYFRVLVNSSDGMVGIDSENADIKKIKINGIEATYSTKDDKNILIWNEGEYLFRVCGNISESEIVKIAENLKK